MRTSESTILPDGIGLLLVRFIFESMSLSYKWLSALDQAEAMDPTTMICKISKGKATATRAELLK